MNELISVIINVYNGEKYIKKCIDSVINQTYKNLEILIINDGSTDNTLSIINEYKDKRIRVITTENLGLSLSRNVGIDNAKGEYLYFIDVDDFIELDTIEYLYKLIYKYNALMSTCNCLDIFNYNFSLKQKKERINLLSSDDYLKKILLSLDRSVVTWNKLISKDLFNNLRFEDRITNDVAFTHKLVMKADKIIFSNQVKYYYLRRSDSITGKHESKRAIDQYKVYLERFNYIKKDKPFMCENEISMLHATVMIYNHNDVTVDNYLRKVNAKKVFDELFSINKVLNSRIKRKEKIKIILYRINPKIERLFQITYNKGSKK